MKRSRSPRNPRNVRDRISDLPDDVLHQIMSFLPFEDTAKTSVLSKTWNSTWRSFPVSLVFNQYSFRQSRHCRNLKQPNAVEQFCKHVNNSISGLSTRRALNKFQVTVNFGRSKRRLDKNLDAWIRYAVENNVKELIVAYHATGQQSKKDGWRYVMPDDALFALSSSVETLDLFGCQFKKNSSLANGVNGVVVRFPRLRKLSLTHVWIDQETLESIVMNSPLLEEININNCEGFQVGIITASNLRRADLCLGRDELQIVGIKAPNLTSLTYSGGLGSLNGSEGSPKLKELKLHDMDTCIGFLGVIKDRFPGLEKLELERCWVRKAESENCWVRKAELMLHDIDMVASNS